MGDSPPAHCLLAKERTRLSGILALGEALILPVLRGPDLEADKPDEGRRGAADCGVPCEEGRGDSGRSRCGAAGVEYDEVAFSADPSGDVGACVGENLAAEASPDGHASCATAVAPAKPPFPVPPVPPQDTPLGLPRRPPLDEPPLPPALRGLDSKWPLVDANRDAASVGFLGVIAFSLRRASAVWRR